MKGLLVDGPNQGTIVNIQLWPNRSNVFKILDPNQPSLLSMKPENDLDPLIVNTYYRYPSNPFAEAYGFDILFRFSSSNRR